MARAWAGVDAGKTHHHCVVIDGDGKKLLSRRVANDEPDLLALIGEVTALAGRMRTLWRPEAPEARLYRMGGGSERYTLGYRCTPNQDREDPRAPVERGPNLGSNRIPPI